MKPLQNQLQTVIHSLVLLQFKQESFKFTVSLSTRESWPMWAVKDHSAQSDFNFKVGFLPRASSWFCSGTDKMEVLPRNDGISHLVLHLCRLCCSECGGREGIPGAAVGWRTGWQGEILGGSGWQSQTSRAWSWAGLTELQGGRRSVPVPLLIYVTFSTEQVSPPSPWQPAVHSPLCLVRPVLGSSPYQLLHAGWAVAGVMQAAETQPFSSF